MSNAAARSVLSCRAITTERIGIPSPKHSLFCQQRSKSLHPLAVYAEVAVPQTGRRAHGYHVLGRSQVQLQIIDKTKERAAALRMNVIVRFDNDFRPGLLGNRQANRSPCVGGGQSKLKRRNLVRSIGGVTRHAVRRRWAGSQALSFDAQVAWPATGAGEERHDDDNGANDPRRAFKTDVDGVEGLTLFSASPARQKT